jgi:hypothetical protein
MDRNIDDNDGDADELDSSKEGHLVKGIYLTCFKYLMVR